MGHFISFGNIAIDPNKVVFEGTGLVNSEQLVKGIYVWTGSGLIKIVDGNDTLGGQRISALTLARRL